MKTRNGFVSNSSSSSFVIVGKLFEFDDFAKMFSIDFSDFSFEVENDWELNGNFTEFIGNCDANLLPDYDIDLYGSFGEHDEVIVYKRVPEDPKKAIEVINEVSNRLGYNVVVDVLKKDSESGIWFGE